MNKVSKNSPISIKEGYGVKGMQIELNLAQIQVLGSIYQSLTRKAFQDLTLEEQNLVPFLEIFKDFSMDRDNLWSNFQESRESE